MLCLPMNVRTVSVNSEAEAALEGRDKDLALYIHVPFCVKRCNYCEFYSCTALEQIDDYCKVLIQHVKSYGACNLYGAAGKPKSRFVRSVYFGGGTPSLIGERLAEVLAAIREVFELSDDCEITVEVNPESFDEQLAGLLSTAGFNRVSVGVQSLNNEALCLLGRSHNSEQALKALRLAHDFGFRTSADLIVGLPTLGSKYSFKDDWRAISALVEHISVYPLTVEEGTPLERMLEEGLVTLPSEDEVATEVMHIEKLLAVEGFERYEISSYAKLGQGSRQNLRYWRGGDYLGFGPNAAGMTNKTCGSRSRYVMYDSLEDFLSDPEGKRQVPAESEALSPNEALREDAMLALRTKRGVQVSTVAAAKLTDICNELVEKRLLIQENDHYRCSTEGWLLGNIVFSAIWIGGK